jgi:hypothetical protein
MAEELCAQLLIKQLMARERNNSSFSSSSSDAIATTCFGHTTIIKRLLSLLHLLPEN